MHLGSGEARELVRYLLRFARNPISEIKKVPHFRWPYLIGMQYILALISGGLSGVVGPFRINIILGILFFPFAVLIMSLISSVFFYYLFQFLFRKTLSLHQLYSIMAFTSVPMLLFHVGSPALPPLDLVGYVVMSFLLVVGLVENCDVPRKPTARVVLGIFIVLVLLWILERIAVDSTFSQ